MWDALKIFREGTKDIRRSKINKLTQQWVISTHLGPDSVLLLKVSGSILSGINLGGLI